MNVKFSASPGQALDYLRRTGAASYFEFQIEGKSSRIMATHWLTDSPAAPDKPEFSWLTDKTGIRSAPWFKSIYNICHGWYYRDFRNAPARYTLYYDLDHQQFYIYWTYS